MKYLPLLFLCLIVSACSSLPEKDRRRAQDFAERTQSKQSACTQADHCSLPSPLYGLADEAALRSRPGVGKHTLILLDQGNDALLARLHMIESAKHSIELQVFIFDVDESGTLVLDALIRAARRGVKVRLLLDQLYGLPDPRLQARLAALHENFELKLYRPMFNQSQTNNAEFFASIVFAYDALNSRMHTKLLLVDDKMAVIGGRNIQDRYFDWGQAYNYRDRDVWVAGPVTQKMAENFNAFWSSERSIPAAQLDDVALELSNAAAHPERLDLPAQAYSERMQAMNIMAGDGTRVLQELRPYMNQVGNVTFFADLPEKHNREASSRAKAANALYQLISEAQHTVILQTPYLVMSRLARQTFRKLQQRNQPVRVWVSSNSLAATDAFPAYALSYKYKRLYIKELGFRIYEFKPYPASALMRVGQSVGWTGRHPGEGTDTDAILGSVGSGREVPVPKQEDRLRVGLHAKSMVVDNRIAVIGSHNFDPRSDDYNTESLLVVDDEAFANRLSASIRIDMQSDNSWIAAPREPSPVLGDFNYVMGKLSEQMPVFDIWPFPYADSYQLKPECSAISFDDPRFEACSISVGDYPEVDVSMKSILTRVLTAFGAGFAPIL